MTLHVGIVGAGIIGLTCAYELAKQGYKITVFDNDGPHQASKAALGLSVVKGNFFPRDELFSLKMTGHKRFVNWLHSLATISGIDQNSLVQSGLREWFITPSDFQIESERAFHGEFTALHRFKLNNQAGVTHLSDLVRTYPDDAHANVPLLLTAMKTFVSKHGKIVKATVLRLEEEREVKVLTEDGDTKCDRVIVAAGIGVSEILKNSRFRVPEFELVPGSSAHFYDAANDVNDFQLVSKYTYSTFGHETRVGSRLFDGESFAKDVQERKIKLANHNAKDISWQYGIRVKQKSRLPFVNAAETQAQKISRKILIATAMYRNGFQLASLVAQFCHNFVRHGLNGQPMEFSAEYFSRL